MRRGFPIPFKTAVVHHFIILSDECISKARITEACAPIHFPISSHLPHEMLPVYFSCAVCLQFEMGGRTRRRISFWWLCRLMIGPLDPVAPKLGQKDEWKWTNTTEHLNWNGEKEA